MTNRKKTTSSRTTRSSRSASATNRSERDIQKQATAELQKAFQVHTLVQIVFQHLAAGATYQSVAEPMGQSGTMPHFAVGVPPVVVAPRHPTFPTV